MNHQHSCMLVALSALAATSACFSANGDVIYFDDAYEILGEGGDPNDYYVNPTFIGDGGLSRRYRLKAYEDWEPGTYGPAFWNCHYLSGLEFQGDVIDFGMDVIAFETVQLFYINFFDDGRLVGSQVFEQADERWEPVVFAGVPFDKVVFYAETGWGPSWYAIDKIKYTTIAGIPAPGTMALLGVAAFALRRRRRRFADPQGSRRKA